MKQPSGDRFYKVDRIFRACIDEFEKKRNNVLCGFVFHLLSLELEICLLVYILVKYPDITSLIFPGFIIIVLSVFIFIVYLTALCWPLFQSSSNRLRYYLILAKQVNCAVFHQPLPYDQLATMDLNDVKKITSQKTSNAFGDNATTQQLILAKQYIMRKYESVQKKILKIFLNIVGVINVSLLSFILYQIYNKNSQLLIICGVTIFLQLLHISVLILAIFWVFACLLSILFFPFYFIVAHCICRKSKYLCIHCNESIKKGSKMFQCAWKHRYHATCIPKDCGETWYCQLCFCIVKPITSLTEQNKAQLNNICFSSNKKFSAESL